MRREEIQDGIADVARRHLGFTGEFAPGLRLVEDLGFDSLKLLTLAAEVENHFRVTLEPDEEAGIATLGDLVTLLQAKLSVPQLAD
ncbi:MAG: acyl carrier protein [Thermoanaerobaculia bacterium]